MSLAICAISCAVLAAAALVGREQRTSRSDVTTPPIVGTWTIDYHGRKEWGFLITHGIARFNPDKSFVITGVAKNAGGDLLKDVGTYKFSGKYLTLYTTSSSARNPAVPENVPGVLVQKTSETWTGKFRPDTRTIKWLGRDAFTMSWNDRLGHHSETFTRRHRK